MKPKPKKKRNGSRKRKLTWDQQVHQDAEELGAEPSKDTREDNRLESELNRLTRDVVGR